VKNPDLRFDPELGKIGGEDMVFFSLAKSKGMMIRFSRSAIVHENEPADRLTFRYQLYRYFWHGNSSYVTQLRNGVGRPRLFVHGGMSLIRAALYSPTRLATGRKPHFRMGLALLAEAAGKIVGFFGVRINHH
jgi:succinoglycan biosynthesis protein ExoM